MHLEAALEASLALHQAQENLTVLVAILDKYGSANHQLVLHNAVQSLAHLEKCLKDHDWEGRRNHPAARLVDD